MSKSIYTLKSPCANCPFRNDNPTYLREERAREIAASLRSGSTFYCHKTVDYVEDPEDDGTEGRIGSRGRACAGALATMEKEGTPHQMVRIAERLGIYDPSVLDMDSPVYDSLTEWVRAHGSTPTAVVDGEEVEYEHCGVVGPDCVDPAGYGGYGGTWTNDEEPTCHPVEDTCQHCGNTVCESCVAEVEDAGGTAYKTCVNCVDQDMD